MKITLCGSTRFMPSFHEWNLRLTKAGHVVYSVAAATSDADRGSNLDPETKLVLDAVHIAKIEESEAIFVITAPHEVIDRKGTTAPYIGESTAREIYYASLRDKAVYYDHGNYTYDMKGRSFEDLNRVDVPLIRALALANRPWRG